MSDLRIVTITVSLIFAGIALAADDSATATHWRTEDGATVVEFGRCGEKYCGHIIAILDERISEADSDALCRLQILGALVPRDDGSWSSGWLLDPETQGVYKVSTRIDETAMTLRVFETVEAWGVNIRWVQVEQPGTFCDIASSNES